MKKSNSFLRIALSALTLVMGFSDTAYAKILKEHLIENLTSIKGVSVELASYDLSTINSSTVYYAKDGTRRIIHKSHREYEYPVSGVTLGTGWNSFTEEKTYAKCIIFTTDRTGGQAATLSVDRVMETDSLRKSMNVNYSALAKAKFIAGKASVSAKTKFVQDTKLINKGLSILVKGTVVNGVEYVIPPVKRGSNNGGYIGLTHQAKRWLEKSSKHFEKFCGDSFVSAIQRGAEVYALYQMADKTYETLKDENVSTAVYGKLFGYSLKGEMTRNAVAEFSKASKVTSLRYYHEAHMGLRLPTDEASIASSIAHMGSATALQDSWPYNIHLVRYENLPGFPKDKDLKAQAAMNEPLYEHFMQLMDLYQVILDIEAHPNNYFLDTADELSNYFILKNKLRDRLEEIEVTLKKCNKLRSPDTIVGEDTTLLDNAKNDGCVTDLSIKKRDNNDYYYRLLMPLPKNQLAKSKNLDGSKKSMVAEIKELKTEANQTILIFESDSYLTETRLKCSEMPVSSNLAVFSKGEMCMDLKKKIINLELKLQDLASGKNPYARAIARYDYWIKGISDYRKDRSFLHHNKTESELELYKQDLFCQYGLRLGERECPKERLSQMFLRESVVAYTKTISLEGYESPLMNTAGKAVSALIGDLYIVASQAIGNRPVYYLIHNARPTINKFNEQYSAQYDSGSMEIHYFVSEKTSPLSKKPSTQ